MKICGNCGYVGREGTRTRGSFLIELVLWLCFIVPGLIYSLWRLTTKEKVCPECKAPHMVPTTSPRGRALAKEFGVERVAGAR